MSGTGDNNVTITIKGTVDPSLAASTSAASAQLNTLNASTGQATATAAQYQAAIKALGTDTRNLTLESLGVGAAAKEASVATDGAAAATVTADTATKGLRLTTSGMIQEYVRMARAIATGRFDILPSELATATSRMGGLSATTLAAYGPMIAVGAAVAAFAVGLGYLAVKAIEADQALQRIMIGAEAAGNTSITEAGIKNLESELTSLSSVSSATANEVIASYSKMSNMSQASLDALTLATIAWANTTDEKAPEVIRQFTDLITNQKLTFEDLQKVFPGVTEAEANNFIQVQKLGDAHRTTAALVALLQTQMESSRQRVIAYNAGWVSLGNDLRLGAGYIQDVIGWLLPLSDGIESGIKLWNETGSAIKEAGGWIQKMTSWIPPLSAAERAQNDLLHESAAAYNAQSTAMANAAKQTGASATNKPFVSSEAVRTELQKIADDVTLTDAQILQKQTTYLQQQVALTKANTTIRGELEQELATRTTELERKSSSDIIETARATEAMRGLIGKARIQDEINTDKQLLANTKVTAQDKLSVAKDEGDKLSQLNQKDATEFKKTQKEELEDQLRTLQEAVAATRAGSQERIDAEQKVLDFANAHYKLLGSAAKAAQDAIYADQRAITDAEINDLQSVEAANIKSSDAIAAEKIKSIQEAFRYGQINADEEIAQARAVENARDDAVQQGLQIQLALAYGNAKELDAVNKLIEAEERTHQKNLTDIDRKGEEDRVAQWRAANSQILSAESTFINDYLSGQKTLGQALLASLGQFIQQQIEAEARKWTEEKLLALEHVDATNAIEKGGLASAIWNNLFETKSVATEQAKQTGLVGSAQIAQTQAVGAGQAAQVAIKTSAAGAGNAAEVAADSASILNSAYTAAASAFKWVMQEVPFPANVAIAPVAAAGTFAAVAAYDSLTALEVGAWEIPSGGPYMLHPGESVVPKDFASGMRAAGFGASPLTSGAGGAGQSGGGDQYHIHMNTIDGRTGAKFLMDNASTIVSMLATQKRNSSSLFNTRPV